MFILAKPPKSQQQLARLASPPPPTKLKDLRSSTWLATIQNPSRPVRDNSEAGCPLPFANNLLSPPSRSVPPEEACRLAPPVHKPGPQPRGQPLPPPRQTNLAPMRYWLLTMFLAALPPIHRQTRGTYVPHQLPPRRHDHNSSSYSNAHESPPSLSSSGNTGPFTKASRPQALKSRQGQCTSQTKLGRHRR